jgi:Asp-tRNA(Asn)/Glu-tRNA(Gln) amidotransferase B subunit
MLNLTTPNVRVEKRADCLIIECSAWIIHSYPDGIRLLPPPKWLHELMDLIETKTISATAAKIVFETWQKEIIQRLNIGIDRLKNLGEMP